MYQIFYVTNKNIKSIWKGTSQLERINDRQTHSTKRHTFFENKGGIQYWHLLSFNIVFQNHALLKKKPAAGIVTVVRPVLQYDARRSSI